MSATRSPDAPAPMTSTARKALAKTIRGLRERLLTDLHDAVEAEYRLEIRDAAKAGLDAARATKRARLDDWIDSQMRGWTAPKAVAKSDDKRKAAEAEERARVRRGVEKEVAWTFLHRLVVLRLLEAESAGDARGGPPALVTGGYDSRAYRELRDWAPALLADTGLSGERDDSQGYAFWLRLVIEERAGALPGLFGEVGLERLIPIPTATLKAAVEALDDKALASCWTDDMTLGWVYQYWNDPEREALDAKIAGGGKIKPHEIASKTQLFTERYMVDWLLQNSLGPMWIELCERHGWPPDILRPGPGPDAKGQSPLDILEERRANWRAKRAAGEVELTALMPLHNELERRWAYYLPPAPEADEEAKARDSDEQDNPPRRSSLPDSVRDWKILDPAVGSGHFLVVAFELLFALYEEEARHRGEEGQAQWSAKAIAERILSENLHGVDIDPRAVQIAAAALWLKARSRAPDARPERLLLVASNLRLGELLDNDPALLDLLRAVEDETKIPQELTRGIVEALQGADHLGSLLKVDKAIDEAVRDMESEIPLFHSAYANARQGLVERLEGFLAKTTRPEDLGLRLRGEQLAAGVRFLRVVREGAYDLIVANPPYQGTSKMKESSYLKKHYKAGKADLYAAFLLRGLELAKPGGLSGMLTMRNWMFIKQFSGLREALLRSNALLALGDFDRGAFESIAAGPGGVSVAVSLWARGEKIGQNACVARPSPIDSVEHDFDEKRAATLAHFRRYDFRPDALRVVPEWPLVYWWENSLLASYKSSPTLQSSANVPVGLQAGNNDRFTRMPHELSGGDVDFLRFDTTSKEPEGRWRPLVKGAAGHKWMEPLRFAVDYSPARNAQLMWLKSARFGQGVEYYFRPMVAMPKIGATPKGRAVRYPSIVDNSAPSVFRERVDVVLCSVNRTESAKILQSLNPTVNLQSGDLLRLPLWRDKKSTQIFAIIDSSFTVHEAHREPSVEFKLPGPSPWRCAQDWAQEAVDRPEGASLPEYVEELDPEPATDHISFALGVALGRFDPAGEGILDRARDDLPGALPDGIAFLDRSLEAGETGDSLDHPAAAPLIAAWQAHGPQIETRQTSLRDYLALDFFDKVHRSMYENRPIHWPLSSAKKTFVAWVTIHRWTADTLRRLLSEHLRPALTRIEGRLNDLRQDRASSDIKVARAAEKAWNRLVGARDELTEFSQAVSDCAEKGPPPTGKTCPPRETDARYDPCLDDGVMINSAALWPLLLPQWKKPKAWWTELARAKGRKDYDWSRLAARYFPTRVDDKCRQDPSLAVAHGRFWTYHPDLAFKWELRLMHELGPDFALHDEPEPGKPDPAAADQARAAFMKAHPDKVEQLVQDEIKRREREYKKLCKRRDAGELFEDEVVPETFEPEIVLR